MAAKTIAVDEEAYALLHAQKKPGESFSEVVKRLAGKRRPLTDFVGIWKDMPEADFRQIDAYIRQGREMDRRRMARLPKE